MNKLILIGILFFISCNSLVTKFDDIEPAVKYSSNSINNDDIVKDTLSVMTWNIRFGAGRMDYFGDHCGERVIFTESEIKENLNQIVDVINNKEVDILLLQEVDVESKRSAYIDEVQYLLNKTHLNYGVYASMHQAQIIPFNGYGRVNVGNAILSRWKLTESERIQLPLMTDQSSLDQYFYLKRNILRTKVEIEDRDNIFAVNTHLTAFATDDTKEKHIDQYIETLEDLNSNGSKFISGGDLNSIPPVNDNDTIPDFCIKDKCENENFHYEADGGPHKSGSYFEYDSNENGWLIPLYNNYNSGIPEENRNNIEHYTHTPGSQIDLTDGGRKLDYLFTNLEKVIGSGKTLQENTNISDHVPVIINVILPEGE